MTSLSPNYSLILYATGDTTEKFLDYRVDIAGDGAGSNMMMVDAQMKVNADAIAALVTSKGAVPVSANFVSGSDYAITGITAISAYDTNLMIALEVDVTTIDTATLNINSLGAKSLMQVNAAGSIVNLKDSQLIAGSKYLFIYDGTRFLLINPSFGHRVFSEGSELTQRDSIDFIGASVVATDGTDATEVLVNGAKLEMNTETLAAGKTLTDADDPIQYLDPDGAERDIVLPAGAATNPIFFISNPASSGYDLVVKQSTTEIVSVEEGQTKILVSDGTTWRSVAGAEGSHLDWLLATLYSAASASDINAGTADKLATAASIYGSNLAFLLATAFTEANAAAINAGTANKLATAAAIEGSNLSWLLASAFSAAVAADVSAGTSILKLMTPDSFAESERGNRYILATVYDDGEDTVVADSVISIPIPEEIRDAGYEISDVEAWTSVAGVTDSTIVQLNNGANDILSTELYIDTTETNSKDSSTTAAINATYKSLTSIKSIDVDVDQISSGTAAKGLRVKLTIRKV